MKRYPEYKDSGIEWIGEIPGDWEVKRLKYFATIKNGQDYKDVEVDNEGYPVIGSGGEFAKASTYLWDRPSVLLGRKGTINKPLYVDFPFWTVDTMYYTDVFERTSAKFLYYLATTIRFDYYQYGSAVPSMTQRDLANVCFATPKTKEKQKLIADYLDRKTETIDNVITDKEKLIELLKEKRQAIISQAVIKGLDPNVPIKDSCIEWIGAIPEDWEVKQFRYCFNTSTGISITRSELSNIGVYCIGYGPIHSRLGFDLDLKRDKLTKAPYEFYDNKESAIAFENDFIFCDTSEDIEGSGNNVYVKDLDGHQLLAGSHTILAHPIQSFESRFLAYLFSTKTWRRQIQSRVFGVKVFSITQKLLNSTYIILPSIEEQRQIINHLDRKTSVIDEIVTDITLQIEKLKEYRQAIISEAVTGKVAI